VGIVLEGVCQSRGLAVCPALELAQPAPTHEPLLQMGLGRPGKTQQGLESQKAFLTLPTCPLCKREAYF